MRAGGRRLKSWVAGCFGIRLVHKFLRAAAPSIAVENASRKTRLSVTWITFISSVEMSSIAVEIALAQNPDQPATVFIL
jgi:hypothetical protein